MGRFCRSRYFCFLAACIIVSILICSFSGLAFASEDPIETTSETQADPDPDGQYLVGVEVTTASVTPNDANGLKKIILQLIGNYVTVTTDYTYQSYSGSVSHSITTDPDYAWMCSLAVFLLMLYCIWRFIGGLFRAKQ